MILCVQPDAAHQRACEQFLWQLPYLLPCGECGFHLLQRLKSGSLSKATATSPRYDFFCLPRLDLVFISVVHTSSSHPLFFITILNQFSPHRSLLSDAHRAGEPRVPELACASRDTFVRAVVYLHNNVNQNNDKRLWTPQEAQKYYASVPMCMYNNNTWTSAQSL